MDDLHLVVAAEVADGLDLAVVLVGPHERNGRVRLGGAAVGDEQPPRRGDALLGGVGPVLEPHELAVEHRVGPARHVAGGDDPRRREQRLVADDPVVEREPGALQPLGHRHHAHADHDDVGVDRAAVVEPDAFDLAIALDRGHPDSQAQVDAVVAVQLAAHHAERLAQAAHERRGQRFEDRDVQAAAPARRRHLGADEAGTDHDDARVVVEPGAQVERVVDGAQHEDAVEVGGVGQHARGGTGGEQCTIERELLTDPVAGVEGEDLGSRVERGGAHAEAQLDVELVVGRPAEREVLRLPFAREQLLGERRAVVRQVGLGPHQDDPAVVAVTAQRLRGPQPRQRGPHHHHGLQRLRPLVPPPTRRAHAAQSRAPDAHRPLSRGGGQGSMVRRSPAARALVLSPRSFLQGGNSRRADLQSIYSGVSLSINPHVMSYVMFMFRRPSPLP